MTIKVGADSEIYFHANHIIAAKEAHFSACFCGVKTVKIMDYWPTSNTRKYKKKCSKTLEYFCGITMDIATIANGISKDLQYYNCVKKFIENWNYSRGFNRTFIPTNR